MTGIDYGRGQTNIDKQTGIRFGIISAHDLEEWFWDEVDCEYDPNCPKCGADFTESELDYIEREGKCIHCKKKVHRDDCFPEEPSRSILCSEGVIGFVDLSNDVWITWSPWVVRGTFCSPCAPGAVSIGSEHVDEGGPLAYALPPEWYREECKPAGLRKREK